MATEDNTPITVVRNYGGFRVNTVTELRGIVTELFGENAWDPFVNELRKDYALPTPEAIATGNLQSGGLVDPGQQPNVAPATTQQGQNVASTAVAGPPPGITNPGPCAHGDRHYFDKDARVGARWECNLPWSKQTKDSRCATIWVKK